MAKLIYATNMSLDGYIEDENGSFDWGEPSEELHSFFNELLRPIGTHLYGRSMYEVMTYWETALNIPDQLEIENDFARIWHNAEKIVYSTTLTTALTSNTRIEHTFDADKVQTLKDTAALDVSIGGAQLAAQAFHAGLIDEFHLIIHPIILGVGKPALPKNLRLSLELVNEQRFDGEVLHLHYRVHRAES